MADLIDRDALMKEICGNECGSVCDEECENVMCNYYDYIMDAPAVNRWIPCSERMPENNVPVLYVWRSQNGAVAVLHGWHFEIRSLGSAWHQSGMGMHRPDEEVTHWMPLPEPPEKEAENE